MTDNQILKQYIVWVTGYVILFISVYALMYWFGFVNAIPVDKTLLNWDAVFYEGIKKSGYTYYQGKECTSGFFPLFPYLWALSNLGPFGISILNGFIYIFSLVFLAKLLKPNFIELGLFMSLPFMFFMFTPFSEALFFLFGTMLLYGIVNEDKKFIFIGLFGASLTRACFLFLVPALVGMMLMSTNKKELLKKNLWVYQLKWFILPIFLGVIVIGIIQYIQTGVFFAYYEIQSNAWHRSFQLPTFPMGRNTDIWIVRLSYINFWVGIIASIIGLKYLYYWLAGYKNIEMPTKIELLAIIYIVMSFISIVFFNPKWYWTPTNYNATYLNGINRYIQANPFMLVFMIFLFRKQKSLFVLFGLFLMTHLVWFLLTPDYIFHIQNYLKILISIGILALYWFYWYSKSSFIGIPLILLSFCLSSIMFNYYMIGVQVD
jgi:hypothetical protein